jgi:hypothetical protein
LHRYPPEESHRKKQPPRETNRIEGTPGLATSPVISLERSPRNQPHVSRNYVMLPPGATVIQQLLQRLLRRRPTGPNVLVSPREKGL